MIYGIRPTLGLAVLTMLGTIGLGALMGLLAGYFRGITEELIMRIAVSYTHLSSTHKPALTRSTVCYRRLFVR